MERHRPYAARTRVRSLRPPRGAATALATVLALLVLPPWTVLSAAQAQLDALRAQIVVGAAQESDLRGRVIAW